MGESHMSGLIPGEYHFQVELGDTICMQIAHDQAEMRQQLIMALGISTLFSGRLVRIEGWLPGLILTVQALKSVRSGDRVSIEHVWPGMYARMTAWIDEPADADALDLSFDGAHCMLIPDAFTWHSLPVAFTLKCEAPYQVGGMHSS